MAGSMSSPVVSRALAAGTRPMVVSTATARAVDAVDDPLEDAAVLAEPGPEELAVLALAEPVHPVELGQPARRSRWPMSSQCCEVVAHVVATEREHGEGVEAELAHRAGWAAVVFSSS